MKKTLFLIHGMWGEGASWYWENYCSFFKKKGYKCITPTLRYHDMEPGSKPHERLGRTSVLDYAEDLEKEISKLKEKPIIIGHSMGGLLAQILASRGLASAIVLVNSAPPRGILVLTLSVLRSFTGVISKWKFWTKPMRLSYKKSVYSLLHLLPEEERKDVFSHFVYESGRAAGEIGFWLFDRRKASHVDSESVTCPVLILSGEKDNINPASMMGKIARRYPHATWKKFSNHAHWMMGEPGWEEPAGYIDQWILEKFPERRKAAKTISDRKKSKPEGNFRNKV